MMASKHFFIIFTMFIIFSHLITPSVSYKYKTGLNSSVALTVMMPLGTPPQWQRMVIDTGSELSWAHCSGNNPSFESKASSSFSNVSYKDPVCVTQIGENTITVTPNRSLDLCEYSYDFIDGTSVKGNLVREIFTFSSSKVTPSMIIGCSAEKDKASDADGMLGMTRGSLSFVSQFNMSRFSYCVPLCANILNISSGSSNSSSSNSSCGTGTFYIGKNPYASSFRYINLLNTSQQGQFGLGFDQHAYYVNLVNISIKGEKLNIIDAGSVMNPNQSRAIMIDSGTQYTFLVDAAYNAVREKVVNLTGNYINKKIMVGVNTQFDMCFKATANRSDVVEKIGDMVFEFDKGFNVTIPRERTLAKIDDQLGYCVAIGRSSFRGSSINYFGHYFQQNLCLEFDIKRNRVGFGNAYGSH